ncbi:MAG TPA: transcriptional regulator [Parvularcula sp.]|nr:transcriptional regulator [Parvularcula sp.]HBS32164.1 transcriptional regulator [Parvularcula sp.]HBS36187.1 transcriptional regulator [Parvularcula sp.]
MTDDKRAHPIDIHVGGRVRLRRTMLGMSQDKLAESLGLTFQQIQKYEKGVNRIGASRVFEISRILGVPIQFFYDDYNADTGMSYGFAESEADDGAAMMGLLNTPEGVQLCKHFASITDPKIRKRVLELVKSLSDEGGAGGAA